MFSLRRRRPTLISVLPVFAAIAICGSSLASAASFPTASVSAANVRAARSPLSGTWSGTYGGAYRGTFTLRWVQSGSRLSGTIKLSNLNAKLPVNGTVRGGTIRFGTVGSAAITYTGSVSGKSMSGRYQTPRGGGSWSARKTS